MTQKNDRRQPAQERSRKRVDAILQAAKELISEKGSAQLKIHEIAERADVTPASIYQYFPSKNSISHALAERSFGQMQEIIQAISLGQLPFCASELSSLLLLLQLSFYSPQ